MRFLFVLCLLTPASCLLGAIEGTVINGSTGQPQPSVTVSLVQPGQNGMQAIATAVSDASGKFSIDHELPPPPALLQADYKGVTYTQVQPPGRPATGIRFQIYESASKAPEAMQMAHLIMIEPSANALEVSETFLIRNESNTTFQDSTNGTAQFYPPAGAGEKVQVSVTPPTQMTINRQAVKATKPGEFKIDYPVRPGETRYDMHYTLPVSDSFSLKVVEGKRPTTIVTPLTVKLAGEGIKEMGVEEQVQARIYQVTGPSFNVKIEGTGSIRERQGNSPDEDPGQPKTTEIMAKVYDRMYWILGLTFGIMALGGTLLFRKGPA
ncbi:MAG TPA: carboxypeptidase-like regulatory domain-containing protein [Bryobacteraceae bacterium]|nr:carboxypeptidase-like regulatory domain-containing protein [Bryobacteraceae bacterium]